MGKFGANATVISKRLDGMWVKTIVLTSPIRRASHAAARCDAAFPILAPKNSSPSAASDTPKRWKKKYERREAVRNPPARLSMPKSEEIVHTARRLSAETTAR